MKTLQLCQRSLILLSALAAPVVAAGCGGAATSTPALPANYRPTADLFYSAVSPQSNADTSRVTTLATSGSSNLNSVVVTASDGTQNLEFSGINRVDGSNVERRFDVYLEAPAGENFAFGQIFPLAFGTRDNIFVRQSSANGDRLWQSAGGVATVTATSPGSIALTLTDARFVPSPTFAATGNFRLNGTIGATGLRAAGG